jgi:hypothetical protein
VGAGTDDTYATEVRHGEGWDSIAADLAESNMMLDSGTEYEWRIVTGWSLDAGSARLGHGSAVTSWNRRTVA